MTGNIPPVTPPREAILAAWIAAHPFYATTGVWEREAEFQRWLSAELAAAERTGAERMREQAAQMAHHKMLELIDLGLFGDSTRLLIDRQAADVVAAIRALSSVPEGSEKE